MKNIKTIAIKFGGLIASLTLAVGVVSTQAAICIIVFHQPKVPQGMNKFLVNT